MLKSFLSMALVLSGISCYAQFTVSGIIRDSQTNKVLPGATVQIDNINRITVTDEFGRFSFQKLPTGEYTLLARYVGYENNAQHISLQENMDVAFNMQESAIMTDEVVVLATRASEKTAGTYTTVNKQAIQKQNFGQDLPFLLNWTPSVVTTSDAGNGVGYTGLRIRGSDGTRINVTINGIPYNDSESLGTFWVDIPDIASSSQSIQVQRGVGTSTNGGGAFGATINLQTNTRNDQPYAELINAAGSFGTRRHTLGFGTGLINDNWVIDGRVSRIVSDGFIDRASADLQSYYFSGGYYSGNTMIKGIVFGGKERTYQSWYGVPESRLNGDEEAMYVTAANEGWNEEQTNNLLSSDSRTFNPYTYQNQVDNYQQDHYQLHLSQRINTQLTFNTSLHYTYGRGYYEEYRYDEDIENYGLNNVIIDDDGIPSDNDTITSTDIIRRRWLDNHFYGVTYSLNYETSRLNMILGGAWNRYDGDHFGEILWSGVTIAPIEYQYYFNNGDKRDFNTYLKTTYLITDKLSAFVDLQYRRIDYKTKGIENKQNELDVNAHFNFFNPKAGLTYDIDDRSQLYASYSLANREPVRDDFVDNPGSTPSREKLQDTEIGYRRATDQYVLSINGYWMNYDDQLVLTGALNDVGASIRTNVDKSYRAGVEIDGLVKLSKQLKVNANLTLSRNKIKEFTEVLYDYGTGWDEYNVIERIYTDTDISFSPNVIASAGLTYTPIDGLDITLLSKHVGRQYLDNTSNKNRSIDAYTVNDLRVGYAFHTSFAKEVSVSLLLNNVFDTRYESNGYTWGYLGGGDEYRENYFYPQAGRNFMVMLTCRL